MLGQYNDMQIQHQLSKFLCSFVRNKQFGAPSSVTGKYKTQESRTSTVKCAIIWDT